MILPTPQWQRAVIAALLVLPLLLVVALSAPGLLTLPFLSTARRTAVLKLLGCLILWVKAIVGST